MGIRITIQTDFGAHEVHGKCALVIMGPPEAKVLLTSYSALVHAYLGHQRSNLERIELQESASRSEAEQLAEALQQANHAEEAAEIMHMFLKEIAAIGPLAHKEKMQ